MQKNQTYTNLIINSYNNPVSFNELRPNESYTNLYKQNMNNSARDLISQSLYAKKGLNNPKMKDPDSKFEFSKISSKDIRDKIIQSIKGSKIDKFLSKNARVDLDKQELRDEIDDLKNKIREMEISLYSYQSSINMINSETEAFKSDFNNYTNSNKYSHSYITEMNNRKWLEKFNLNNHMHLEELRAIKGKFDCHTFKSLLEFIENQKSGVHNIKNENNLDSLTEYKLFLANFERDYNKCLFNYEKDITDIESNYEEIEKLMKSDYEIKFWEIKNFLETKFSRFYDTIINEIASLKKLNDKKILNNIRVDTVGTPTNLSGREIDKKFLISPSNSINNSIKPSKLEEKILIKSETNNFSLKEDSINKLKIDLNNSNTFEKNIVNKTKSKIQFYENKYKLGGIISEESKEKDTQNMNENLNSEFSVYDILNKDRNN